MCICFVFHESEAFIVSKSSTWKGVFVVRRCFLGVNFFAITFGMETSISVSELSTENGVAVENAYGSIIGDDEDHVDERVTGRFGYPLFAYV